jgi:hypothetical protein
MYSLLQQDTIRSIQRERLSRKVFAACVFLAILPLLGCVALIPAFMESGMHMPWEMLMPKVDKSLIDLPTAEGGAQATQTGQDRALQLLTIAEDELKVEPIVNTLASIRDSAVAHVDVQIVRVAMLQKNVTVTGSTKSRNALVAFIADFRKDPLFARVDVPVSDLAGHSDTFPFTMTLTPAEKKKAAPPTKPAP